MRKHIVFLTLFYLLAAAVVSAAESPSTALSGSNLLNPNVSVIGWLQGEVGKRHLEADEEEPAAMELKEAEIAFQAIVDPYSRADVILSATEEGLEIEEGTLSWFHLPGGLGLKAGKFKANLGKFNRVHTAETAFADRPLVHQLYFGDEGLSGTGGSLNWTVPVPFYLTADVEAFTTPDEGSELAFQKSTKKDLTYVGRLATYADLTESANVTLGLNSAFGPAGNFIDVDNATHTLRSNVNAVDLTFRWKNPRQAIYRSLLWQTEFLQSKRDISDTMGETAYGMFTHLEYQFARRWKAGGRWDYAESPTDKHSVEKGGLAYITFTPSEFSLVSIQGRRRTLPDGDKETLGFLKVTFNIGPHGAHPF